MSAASVSTLIVGVWSASASAKTTVPPSDSIAPVPVSSSSERFVSVTEAARSPVAMPSPSATTLPSASMVSPSAAMTGRSLVPVMVIVTVSTTLVVPSPTATS